MKDSVYLVYNEDGIRKTPKTLRGVEQGPGLYVQKVTLNVPDEVFERAVPDAEVEVPAQDAQPTDVRVNYADEGICTAEPVEDPSADTPKAYQSLYRCPECGAEKVTTEPFGIHYEPEEDGA